MIYVENREINQHEAEVGYSADASDLGLKPGIWPEELSGMDAAGEPLEFRRIQAVRVRNDHSELAGYIYEALDYRLVVFND